MNAPIPVHRIPLPAMLQCTLDTGGMDAVIALTRGFGGKNLYIPRVPEKAGDHHPLVAAVGRKTAEAIMRQFGGSHCEVPTTRGIRQRLALALLSQGTARNQVVEKTGLCHRQVRRLDEYLTRGNARAFGTRRRGKPVDPRQIDIELFLKTS